MENQEHKISISAVIPAYNEEHAVAGVVEELKNLLTANGFIFEIIVVDDGSDDSTTATAQSAGAKVLCHPINRGYGRALLSGIEKARYEWILMIDADGSYPVKEMEKLLPFAPDFDMIVGARQGTSFWGSWIKAVMRFIYLSIARFVAGEPIPDANSGLRLLRKSALQTSMPILCYGYSFTTTMTLSFLKSGKFVKFIPIEFTERIGKSKIKPVRDILRTLQIMTQVMIYYNPLKFAVTLAIIPLALGLFKIFSFYAAISLFVLIFLAGCLMESIKLYSTRNDESRKQ